MDLFVQFRRPGLALLFCPLLLDIGHVVRHDGARCSLVSLERRLEAVHRLLEGIVLLLGL